MRRILLDENTPHRLRHDLGDAFEVVVVIAGGNRYADLAPLVGRIKEALNAAEPGTVTRVVV